MNVNFSKICLILFLSGFELFSFSQNADTAKPASRFTTVVTLTTKGISTIPNLTLGKPAVLFDMIVGRKLTFEPQFRFALDGKPWTFVFWWRYKLWQSEKFSIVMGAHPAYSFKTIHDTIGGVSKEIIAVNRYLAGDLAPVFLLTDNFGIGLYYLYSHGIDKDATNNTHLVALRANLLNIKVSDKFYMRFNPQVYYLNMDEKYGFYFNAALVLARENFPLSASALINRSIQTEIPAKVDFLWNVSLVYTFTRQYVEK
ncbi:MAG: hypothetical protein JW830_07145 [Bacteroidales bacterium]|nr:hypothetical protein [Bacteroidales bacterium]